MHLYALAVFLWRYPLRPGWTAAYFLRRQETGGNRCGWQYSWLTSTCNVRKLYGVLTCYGTTRRILHDTPVDCKTPSAEQFRVSCQELDKPPQVVDYMLNRSSFPLSARVGDNILLPF